MRTSRLVAPLVAGFFALSTLALWQPAFAQAPNGPTKNVVVIDIGKVFKEHLRFRQQMEVLKKDMEAFQAYTRNEQTKIQERAEKAKATFAKGSPEFKKEDEALQRLANELQLQVTQKQKDLMEREAKVYYNVYNEVATAVASFADRNGITLVLRYNSDPCNPDDRNSVLAAVNNSIVFQRNLDITNIVIKSANQGVAPPPDKDDPSITRRPGSQIPKGGPVPR